MATIVEKPETSLDIFENAALKVFELQAVKKTIPKTYAGKRSIPISKNQSLLYQSTSTPFFLISMLLVSFHDS